MCSTTSRVPTERKADVISEFRLLMIGAMYENGGNTTQRLLDGHPEMFVYPFESQLGTKYVNDYLASMFSLKYRGPTFPLRGGAMEDYAAIIDEECKVRARTPHVSKFRHVDFDFSDDERARLFVEHTELTGRSRAGNVAAFFTATFESWRNLRRSGKEQVYVGYSPIVVVDAGAILGDLPAAHFLHVVRNPWSAYADTKKRPVPLSMRHYMLGWVLNQYHALLYREEFPERMHVVRAEDVMAAPRESLGKVCASLGLSVPESLSVPSWNGEALREVYPWGTIRVPTPEANEATARELSVEEVEAVRSYAGPYLEPFGYEEFL